MEEVKKEKRCKKCGGAFTKPECPPCKAVAIKIYKAKNADKIRAQSREYYAANKEVIRAKLAADYAANPEKEEMRKAAVRAWQKENSARVYAGRAARKLADPEKHRAARLVQVARVFSDPERLRVHREKKAQYMRDNYVKNTAYREGYRAENSAKIVAKVAEWRSRNWEAVGRHANNRRARKLEVGGTLSKGLRDRLFELQKGKCACCGVKLGKVFHMDHITPLARGGTNDDSNIQLLRPKCNAQKSAKDPIEFMQERGFLL